MIYIVVILLSLFFMTAYKKIAGTTTRHLLTKDKTGIHSKYVFSLIVLLIGILLLALFSGFRGLSVGVDTDTIYYNYYYLYYCVNNYDYEGSEVLFILLIKCAYYIFHSYTGVLFTISALTIIFTYCGIIYFRNHLDVTFALLIFLCFIYFSSFNTMRQYLAASIIFLGYRFIDRKQYIRFIIVLLLAFFIHNSSLICVSFLIFKLFEDRRKILTILFIFALVLFAVLPSVIVFLVYNLGIGNYASRDYINQIGFDISITNFSIFIFYLPAFVICIFFSKRLVKKDKNNLVLLILFVLAVFCGLTKIYMVWLSRLMVYFSFSMCLLLPQCIKLCQSKNGVVAFKAFLIFYCLGYFVLNYIVLGNGLIYPYELSF